MFSLVFWSVLLIASCIAWLLTRVLLSYALAKQSLLDVPNDRSMHRLPTPRGGGIAFVVSFLLILPIFVWMGMLPLEMAVAFGGAGGAVAAIGFMDDRGHVAVRWRLFVHFTCALWLLFWVVYVPGADIKLKEFISSAFFSGFAAVIGIVWLLNIYNFMDGIDGLAAVQAIFVSASGAFLYFLTDSSIAGVSALLLAAAVFGFLLWNIPPARIFMGDAGSGFLGIILAGLTLVAAVNGVSFFCAWLILQGVFIVDATWTLLRRLLRGEAVYRAHRTHGYQQIARKLGQHKPVLLCVFLINMAILFPIALAVVKQWVSPYYGVLFAYSLLLIIAILCGSGEEN